MFYKLVILLLVLLSSCSKYTVDDGKDENIPISLKLNNTPSEEDNLMFPISVYCINQKDLSVINKDFNQGEPLAIDLPEGEYSINVLCGLDKDWYSAEKNFEQRPIVRIKENGYSVYPLKAAQTILKIEKATEINLVPTYIVSSVEFELENIPNNVESISATLSPVFHTYDIGRKEYAGNSTAEIGCAQKNGNKWSSGTKYVFPSSANGTKITINMNYGGNTKSYSYTLRKPLECGTPYRFTGKFNGDGGNNGGLDMEGDFTISCWNMKEEISFDLGNGVINNGTNNDDTGDGNMPQDTDIETYYVNGLPSRFDIFGPLFVWKSEAVRQGEAIATVIAPMQWPEILAKDAIPAIKTYSVDGITGWRMFTREEAKEFYRDFVDVDNDINTILYNNGDIPFYYEDNERYLCDNARYTFSLYSSKQYPAGEKTKYYLRPVKTMRLVVKNPIGQE